MRTLFSGVSRGTETLVFRGGVPESQYDVMRAPFQEGELPGPVKYGYLNVGVVEAGPPDLVGRTVFCLYPHQTAYVVPADGGRPSCPTACRRARRCWPAPSRPRSTRSGTPRPLVGDRVAVVGAGMVGCCVARLLAGIPGVEVTLVDVDADRAAVAAALGVGFAAAATTRRRPRPGGPHQRAPRPGCSSSLDLLGAGRHGHRPQLVRRHPGRARRSAAPSTPRRLAIRASQVGEVAPARRGRRTHADRLRLALTLLRDPAFDALLTGDVAASPSCPR